MSPFRKHGVKKWHGEDVDGDQFRLTRRQWLTKAPVTAAALAGIPAALFRSAHAARPEKSSDLYAGFPSQDPAVVLEVVRLSHFDLEGLSKLVTASPALAKAARDWGFGDWESALGAASHMGRRDIAEFLIGHGARPNLFTFAMLGHLEVVQAYVRAMPGIQRIPGPHGITLMAHARNGGAEAEDVVDFLETLGDADIGAVSLEISEEEKKIYLGAYESGEPYNIVFDVIENSRGSLAIKRGDGFGRSLNRVEEHGFAPAGAGAVRVRFQVHDNQAVSLTIHDPDPLVTARRLSQ